MRISLKCVFRLILKAFRTYGGNNNPCLEFLEYKQSRVLRNKLKIEDDFTATMLQISVILLNTIDSRIGDGHYRMKWVFDMFVC